MVSGSTVILKEKWLGNDTFLIVAKGSPGKENMEIDKLERRRRAIADAEFNAQRQMLRRLTGLGNIHHDPPLDDFLSGRVRHKSADLRDLVRVIKDGAICKEYCLKNDDCIIVYYIETVNLKKLAVRAKEQRPLPDPY